MSERCTVVESEYLNLVTDRKRWRVATLADCEYGQVLWRENESYIFAVAFRYWINDDVFSGVVLDSIRGNWPTGMVSEWIWETGSEWKVDDAR